jgi:Mrp family chromosome partitioning ATPase
LCSAASAGQCWFPTSYALVGSRGGHHFDDRIELDLKGLPEPVRAFTARWEPPTASRIASLPAALEVAARSVFVGRADAIAVLDDAAARSMSAGRQMVLISGEPGQGKTRLAAEMAGRAAARGSRVLFGRRDEDLPQRTVHG